MSNKKYTAAVIGLGNIGMGYDYSSSDDQRVMTHSAAYFYHPGYQLVAAVDPDINKRTLFSKKYEVPAYTTIEEMCLKTEVDVYSIAAPTEYHYDLFCQLLHYKPKAILCEKPMSYSLEKAETMRLLAEQNNILLFINYMRRFEPGVHAIKKFLKENKLGKVYKVIAKYSNGFLNCATHFLDLAHYFFGRIDSITPMVKGKNYNPNHNIDFQCKISNIDLYFIAISGCDYLLYELEIIAERGVLRYLDAGHKIQCQLSSTCYEIDNVSTLMDADVKFNNDYYRFQWYVVEALYQSLLGRCHLSNVKEAVEVLRVASMILN